VERKRKTKETVERGFWGWYRHYVTWIVKKGNKGSCRFSKFLFLIYILLWYWNFASVLKARHTVTQFKKTDCNINFIPKMKLSASFPSDVTVQRVHEYRNRKQNTVWESHTPPTHSGIQRYISIHWTQKGRRPLCKVYKLCMIMKSIRKLLKDSKSHCHDSAVLQLQFLVVWSFVQSPTNRSGNTVTIFTGKEPCSRSATFKK
jgi:hypothetical protein